MFNISDLLTIWNTHNGYSDDIDSFVSLCQALDDDLTETLSTDPISDLDDYVLRNTGLTVPQFDYVIKWTP